MIWNGGRQLAIVDAGAIVAAADADEPVHEPTSRILQDPRVQLVLPTLVIAEAAHFLEKRFGPDAELRFLRSLPAFLIEPPNDEDWPRIVSLVEQYLDFPLGIVDASIVALAERLHIDTIITLDYRHFRAVRPRHTGAFRLLPELEATR